MATPRYGGPTPSQHGPFPVLELGPDLITSSDHVHLLELRLRRILTSIDTTRLCRQRITFLWLRQLRRTRRSLDQESAATLVHAFVTSRVDYCNILLAGALKVGHD